MPDRKVEVKNLFDLLPAELPEEWTEVLVQSPEVRIERIVSRGHSSPEGFWYDQEESEFVLMISGSARMTFAHDGGQVTLKPGDCLNIAAHVRHRVDTTAEGEDTVWLAVYYR